MIAFYSDLTRKHDI